MIKQKKLAASIAAAVGTTALASGASIAATGLWPQVVYSPSVTTVVSVINKAQVGTVDALGNPIGYDPAGSIGAPGENLHYILVYKPLTASSENNAAACTEVNQFLPTSFNDVQTIDLGAHFGASTEGVLFNDPSVNNNWMASGKTYAMAAITGETALRGYLLIDNSVGGAPGTISGDAMVFEYTNGATWGYEALESTNADFNFQRADALTTRATVSLKPWEEITTAFMMTPLNGDMARYFNSQVVTRLGTQGGLSNSVIFDRDENAVSGTVQQGVTCVGRVDAPSLLSSGAANLTPDGGWGVLQIAGVNSPTWDCETAVTPFVDDRCVFGAVSYQLEYGVDTFNGESMPGTFNNGYLLRNDP